MEAGRAEAVRPERGQLCLRDRDRGVDARRDEPGQRPLMTPQRQQGVIGVFIRDVRRSSATGESVPDDERAHTTRDDYVRPARMRLLPASSRAGRSGYRLAEARSPALSRWRHELRFE